MKYTDLAIESAEILRSSMPKNSSQIPGISIAEHKGLTGVLTTRITIETEDASRRMGKPCGTYVTIESQDFLQGEPEAAIALREAVATELSLLLPFHQRLKVLIVGIGNEKITPDSLGPHTISKVRITRPLFVTYEADSDTRQANVAALNPGVMAQTGIETAEIIRKLVEHLAPEAVICVDSLAARDPGRMNTTIQLTDTGIAPGAGAKNNRALLNKETLGCKVLAIGVPTVIHCQSLLNDPQAPDMIVTATNIDHVIHAFSTVIAEGLNLALHPGLSSENHSSSSQRSSTTPSPHSDLSYEAVL